MPATYAPDAHADEHVAELRDGGVREHLLDVPLLEADRRREDRGERADDHDGEPRHRRHREEEAAARDQVDARGDHRRRVDERRDRRRAGHGVGQPDVERDLRALAGAAEEEEEADRRHDRPAERRAPTRPRCTPTKSSVPRFANSRNIAIEEAEVADAVDDERLLARVGVRLLAEPEADEQIRTEPDAFPPDEEHRIVARRARAAA